VAEDSPYRDRLAVNMIVIEVNREAVTDLASARGRLQSGRNLLAVYDGRAVRFVVITLRRE